MKEKTRIHSITCRTIRCYIKENLQKCKVIRISKTRYTHIYVWIKFMWSNCEITGITNMEVLFTHVTINKTRRDKEKLGFPFDTWPFSFKVGSKAGQQNVDRWESISTLQIAMEAQTRQKTSPKLYSLLGSKSGSEPLFF